MSERAECVDLSDPLGERLEDGSVGRGDHDGLLRDVELQSAVGSCEISLPPRQGLQPFPTVLVRGEGGEEKTGLDVRELPLFSSAAWHSGQMSTVAASCAAIVSS